MSIELQGRVAIVTGGGQGIGRGIVERLREDGWRVAVADIDAQAAAETACDYGDATSTLAVSTDVADETSVMQLVAATRLHFGRLDALVNNAGLADPQTGAVESLSLQEWRHRLGVHLDGVFLCCKHATPLLRERRGAIVNIASTRALQSEPGCEAYAAAQGGVVALTHALAISLGPQVRVNCISPGWIAVDEYRRAGRRGPVQLRPVDEAQHPVGRAGRPADIAALTAFLLSGQSGFITGQNFVVDGGMTRRMQYLD